mgnify:CR=1 FL=1
MFNSGMLPSVIDVSKALMLLAIPKNFSEVRVPVIFCMFLSVSKASCALVANLTYSLPSFKRFSPMSNPLDYAKSINLSNE